MRDGGGDCSVTNTCNDHPASDCPPFCSPDGQPHGPSTGNNDWFDDVDYDIHPARKEHHGHSIVPGWVSSAADKTSHGLGVARNYTEAIVTTPEVWIGGAETAGSLILITTGATGDAASGLLCATGIGCFAGAPLAAVSSAAVIAGAYGSVYGAKDLGDGLNKAFNEASGDGGSGSSGDVALGTDGGTADALKSFTSTKPETEFVFDSSTKRFLAGDRERIPGGLSPHEQLAEKAGMDRETVLGGTLFRDNGRLVFTENSGHYGHRWTDSTRQQFQTFMSDQGISFDYRQWG
jgi:hypothetical protein